MSADEFSIEAARTASDLDQLDRWVAEFLASPGSDNADLAQILWESHRWWVGPVELPLDRLNRLAGPPGEPVLEVVAESEWRDDVDDLAHKIAEGLQPPPVIVTFDDDELVVEDGNHRLEALRRAGRSQAWAVVGFEDAADRERFEARSSG